MITTFNVDAAKSIKNKIVDLFGYMPDITLGTIDSISKKFYYKFLIQSRSQTCQKQLLSYGYIITLLRVKNCLVCGTFDHFILRLRYIQRYMELMY